eukprot:5332438-Amphidinium_carterae.2
MLANFILLNATTDLTTEWLRRFFYVLEWTSALFNCLASTTTTLTTDSGIFAEELAKLSNCLGAWLGDAPWASFMLCCCDGAHLWLMRCFSWGPCDASVDDMGPVTNGEKASSVSHDTAAKA